MTKGNLPITAPSLKVLSAAWQIPRYNLSLVSPRRLEDSAAIPQGIALGKPSKNSLGFRESRRRKPFWLISSYKGVGSYTPTD